MAYVARVERNANAFGKVAFEPKKTKALLCFFYFFKEEEEKKVDTFYHVQLAKISGQIMMVCSGHPVFIQKDIKNFAQFVVSCLIFHKYFKKFF